MTGNTISVDKDTRDPVFDMQKVLCIRIIGLKQGYKRPASIS